MTWLLVAACALVGVALAWIDHREQAQQDGSAPPDAR